MRFFRRRPHPTADWTRDPTLRLVADLDRFALNDVDLGEGIERLHTLGPSASPFFDYPNRGLRLDVRDGKFFSFSLALRDGVWLGDMGSRAFAVRAFDGHVRMKGREWRSLELRRESDFTGAWGEPYWRDEDEDEILLFFEFPRGELTVELTKAGEPQVIVVSPEAVMADPEQRRAYGVTGDLPPTGSALDT